MLHDPRPTRRLTLGLGAAALLAACQPSAPSQALSQQIADPVARRFYAARNWQPAWDDDKAQALSKIITGAAAHGLAPGAFTPRPLPGLATDENLTLAALAYAKALASGFVDPHQIEPIFTLERNTVDLAAGLAQALGGDLAGWFASLPPADAEYRALSAAYLATLKQPPPGQPAVPAALTDQARRLAANLERRRWLSRTPTAHRIDVNIAAAFLDYFRPGQSVSAIRTVVGRNDHQTPSIQASFHKLVANPPWNVPPDIAAKEILPKGPGYMASQDMHMVNGMVQQAAGPKSALGLVKFDVEDPYDIYLHDTPSKAAFALPERHRSHGCVRVQNAVAFARSIAAETGKTDEFDQALASQNTTDVDLGQSIAVRMLYHTAYFDSGGQVQLAPDVYEADARLATALGLGQAAAATTSTEPAILFGP